jgi:hypothetical protein
MMHRVAHGLANRMMVVVMHRVAHGLANRSVMVANGLANRVTDVAAAGMTRMAPVIIIKVTDRTTHGTAPPPTGGSTPTAARGGTAHVATAAAPIVIVPIPAAFDALASQRNPRRQHAERQQSQKLAIHDPYSQYEKRER